jgi:tRNA 2-thiocytidine biosynthesis protein TtcA
LDPKSEELRWFALPSDGDFVKPLDASASQGDHSLSKPPTSVTEAAGLVGGSAAASAPPPPAAAAVAAAAASTAQPGAGKKKKGGGAVGAGGAPPNAKGQQKKITKKLLKLTGSAISDYSMIRDGDRILVGLSGGKDSLTLLNLLLALQKKAPVKFHLGVCTVDPMTEGFDPAPLKGYVRETLGLDYFFESQPIIAEAETHMQKDSICAYCSRMKRGILYTTARREKYNVLALGQHLDDLAESFVMSAFNNGRLRTMKAHYEIEAGDMRVIRPLSYLPRFPTARQSVP